MSTPDTIATTLPARCAHCRRESEHQVTHCPIGGLCAVCPGCGHHKSLTQTKPAPPPGPTLFPAEPRP